MRAPKAIILSAGTGSRLRPLTDSVPKCLVEYQGRPIIDWSLAALGAAGVTDIVVVGGYCGHMLRTRASRLYINEHYESTNMVESLFCAESEFDSDVIISYGDIAYRTSAVRALLDSSEMVSVVIDRRWKELWKQRMEDPLADAETLILSPEGRILEIGEKPLSESDIHGQYIGLLKIRAPALALIREFYHSLDRDENYRGRPFRQMYMTTFLQLIIDRLMPIHAVPIEGGWIEIDSPSDLDCTMIE